MTKRTFLMILLMVCAIGGAKAQQLTTKGTLQDATSGETLPFTNCVLLRQQDSTFVQGTTTDASGLFRFSPVDTGSYLLRISAIGYEPYWQQISLPPDTALGTISLFHSATNLQAVSVTAQRPLSVPMAKRHSTTWRTTPVCRLAPQATPSRTLRAWKWMPRATSPTVARLS